MKALCYVEIDVDSCSLTYGVSPCTASIPTTGTIKCFNSLGTCQDRSHFTNSPMTLRFSMDYGYLPLDIEAIPCIKSISMSPSTIGLGTGLGQRGTVTVGFGDHRHSDTGLDKYLSTRGYDPFKQGTFWGKFRARNPYLRGRTLRVYRGSLGQTLAQMEVRTYIIESFGGPNPAGDFVIVAKDVLKLADDTRSQAPKLSYGQIPAGNLTSVATSFTLAPAGIGSTYPTSGYVAIGGQEIVAFTRSGDVMTITRAQFGTTNIAHTSGDRVQLCLQYTSADPADIIYDLMVTYAGIPASYIDLTTWKAETAAYLQRTYTTLIADPVGVRTLISELIEQSALAIWWDERNAKVRLQVLREIDTTAHQFTEDNVMEGTLSAQDQPDTRLSQVWTYFGQRNPLLKIDETTNYRVVEATVDLQAETDYGSLAIKRIFSRWISQFGRTTATRLNAILLARYRDPPRKFAFEVFRTSDDVIALGGGYQLGSRSLQDETGAAVLSPIQVTRLNPLPDKFQVEAEEVLFGGVTLDNPNDRVVIVANDTTNFNLKTAHDSVYPEITNPAGLTLKCIVLAGVKVGSVTTALPAFDVGSWPAGLPITVQVLGRIQGKGGQGGTGGTSSNSTNGSVGGPALYTRYAISLDNSAGQIFGGGGGGGGGTGSGSTTSGGGGGAGYNPGLGGAGPNSGNTATTEAGGATGVGTNPGAAGGGPGLSGSTATSSPNRTGGAAGASIDGVSFVTTIVGAGDRRGGQIN